jgi:hypothetical protein
MAVAALPDGRRALSAACQPHRSLQQHIERQPLTDLRQNGVCRLPKCLREGEGFEAIRKREAPKIEQTLELLRSRFNDIKKPKAT